MEYSNKPVARDEINGVTVSTVFLGIDHGLPGSRSPILFETMVFDLDDIECDDIESELYMERYSTWAEAIVGHHRAVEYVRAELKRRSGNIKI